MSHHTKTTTKINVQISNAEKALDQIVDLVPWSKELTEAINTIQLVLKVCEHKMLRVEDLEREVLKLRAAITVNEIRQDADLVAHCIDLETEILELKRKLENLEDQGLRNTGTD